MSGPSDNLFTSCAEVRGNIDAYISNELPTSSVEAFRAHLEKCSDCRALVDNRLRVRRSLREAVRGQGVPSGLRDRITTAVRDVPPRASVLPFWSASRIAWAAAACLVVAVALATLTHDSSIKPAATASDMAAVHARVMKVLDIGYANHIHCTLQHDLAGLHCDDSELVEDLGAEYLPLVSFVRGRISDYTVVMAHHCAAYGHKFTHLILRKENTYVSIAITSRGTETFRGDTAAAVRTIEGIRLYSEVMLKGNHEEVTAFEAGSYLVFFTSTTDRQETMRVASALAPGLGPVLKSIRPRACL